MQTPEIDLNNYLDAQDAFEAAYESAKDRYDSQYVPGVTCPKCLSKKVYLDDDGYFCDTCYSIWEPTDDVSDMMECWIKKEMEDMHREP